MENIYIFKSGELKRIDNTIVLITEEKNINIPVKNTESIKIFSEITLNKSFLSFCSENRIPIHFFTKTGTYKGTYYPEEKNQLGNIFLKQAEFYTDLNKRLELAKLFVFGEIMSIKKVLDNYRKKRENKIDFKKITIETAEARSINKLMSIEGYVREEYYKNFDSIISKKDFIFEKRTKRPPKNEVNALISFGNTILYSDTLKNIYNSHLDARIGYLHSTNERNFTLNLDISEIFKPIIIDEIIFYGINKNIFKKNNFEKHQEGIYLNDSGKKSFILLYEQKLKETKEMENGKYLSYKTLMQREIKKLENHLTEKEKYFPYTEVR